MVESVVEDARKSRSVSGKSTKSTDGASNEDVVLRMKKEED